MLCSYVHHNGERVHVWGGKVGVCMCVYVPTNCGVMSAL